MVNAVTIPFPKQNILILAILRILKAYLGKQFAMLIYVSSLLDS